MSSPDHLCATWFSLNCLRKHGDARLLSYSAAPRSVHAYFPMIAHFPMNHLKALIQESEFPDYSKHQGGDIQTVRLYEDIWFFLRVTGKGLSHS